MVHTRTIVGHGVISARDVEQEGEVPVEALVEGGEPKKVGAGAVGSDRAAAVPGDGGDVVAHGVGGGFTAGGVGGDDILVQDGAGEFEVAVGERAVGVGIGDELGLDLGGPCGAPKKRWKRGRGRGGGRAIWREPDATGARLGGVTGTDLGGSGWNDFGDAGRAGRDILGKFPEIFDLVADRLGETDASAVTVAEGRL